MCVSVSGSDEEKGNHRGEKNRRDGIGSVAEPGSISCAPWGDLCSALLPSNVFLLIFFSFPFLGHMQKTEIDQHVKKHRATKRKDFLVLCVVSFSYSLITTILLVLIIIIVIHYMQ
ncbi:hypothetical protein QBC45DRAFT_145514 [Copromyces sp. CBS 386.78]|nr:hypothetical protein QBC45DRAFT_145514 [Copromyces sp. CBS 386.78]